MTPRTPVNKSRNASNILQLEKLWMKQWPNMTLEALATFRIDWCDGSSKFSGIKVKVG